MYGFFPHLHLQILIPIINAEHYANVAAGRQGTAQHIPARTEARIHPCQSRYHERILPRQAASILMVIQRRFSTIPIELQVTISQSVRRYSQFLAGNSYCAVVDFNLWRQHPDNLPSINSSISVISKRAILRSPSRPSIHYSAGAMLIDGLTTPIWSWETQRRFQACRC
jgi:hypothetical protein